MPDGRGKKIGGLFKKVLAKKAAGKTAGARKKSKQKRKSTFASSPLPSGERRKRKVGGLGRKKTRKANPQPVKTSTAAPAYAAKKTAGLRNPASPAAKRTATPKAAPRRMKRMGRMGR